MAIKIHGVLNELEMPAITIIIYVCYHYSPLPVGLKPIVLLVCLNDSETPI